MALTLVTISQGGEVCKIKEVLHRKDVTLFKGIIHNQYHDRYSPKEREHFWYLNGDSAGMYNDSHATSNRLFPSRYEGSSDDPIDHDDMEMMEAVDKSAKLFFEKNQDKKDKILREEGAKGSSPADVPFSLLFEYWRMLLEGEVDFPGKWRGAGLGSKLGITESTKTIIEDEDDIGEKNVKVSLNLIAKIKGKKAVKPDFKTYEGFFDFLKDKKDDSWKDKIELASKLSDNILQCHRDKRLDSMEVYYTEDRGTEWCIGITHKPNLHFNLQWYVCGDGDKVASKQERVMFLKDVFDVVPFELSEEFVKDILAGKSYEEITHEHRGGIVGKNLGITESEESSVPVVPVGLRGDAFYVRIGDQEYGYKSIPQKTVVVGGIPLEELVRKFTSMMKYSPWKALEWLKKNSSLVMKPRQPKPTSDI